MRPVVGDDAIVRYNLTVEAADRAGQTIPIRIGVMEVWQKRVGNWTMFAHQAYLFATPNYNSASARRDCAAAA